MVLQDAAVTLPVTLVLARLMTLVEVRLPVMLLPLITRLLLVVDTFPVSVTPVRLTWQQPSVMLPMMVPALNEMAPLDATTSPEILVLFEVTPLGPVILPPTLPPLRLTKP